MSIQEPFADDLTIGVPLPQAPAITIDEGVAAQYQGITGDALRIPLSAALSQQATGLQRLANPALVLQIAIGQSTVATRRVIANLFYRKVRLFKQVPVGTTLETTVVPIAAALARPTPSGDRAKVLLSITTRDEHGAVIADFERLALLPVRNRETFVESGSVGTAEDSLDLENYAHLLPDNWNLDRLPAGELPGKGTAMQDPLVEPVTEAQTLVRLTQNLAAAHRDFRRGQHSQRLVYGGHTIGLAQAALTRMDPAIATVLGWHSCDHLGPVYENDLLSFSATLLESAPQAVGSIAAYRVTAHALRPGGEPVSVLSWVPVVWTASRTNALGQP